MSTFSLPLCHPHGSTVEHRGRCSYLVVMLCTLHLGVGEAAFPPWGQCRSWGCATCFTGGVKPSESSISVRGLVLSHGVLSGNQHSQVGITVFSLIRVACHLTIAVLHSSNRSVWGKGRVEISINTKLVSQKVQLDGEERMSTVSLCIKQWRWIHY